MPKMKTNKAAARRFKLTATGKLLRKQAGRRHINEWKSPDKKRNLRGWIQVAPEFKKHVMEMFPYKQYLR
ncbi:MAG TPA: 50S ribosomal protein L35 [Candidatus Obscuribacterales bacterium]